MEQEKRFENNAVAVTAVCTDISFDNASKKVRMKYEYQGKIYEKDARTGIIDIMEGEEWRIYINPSDPNDFRLELQPLELASELKMGGCFLFLGTVVLLLMLKKN